MSETTPGRPRVFLCHSSTDKKAVRELYQRLCWDGYEPWLDEEDLLPGQLWETEIEKAVRSSAAVVVCLSQSATEKAGFVQKEVRFALDVADRQPEGKIFLIPVKLEECVVPDRLRQWHWVNLFEPQGYERLVKALRAKGIAPAAVPDPLLRLSVHRAFFLSGAECFFVNATNPAVNSDIEITHIWFETSPMVHVLQSDRPLPKRLKPKETWETWIRVELIPEPSRERAYTLARARLSTGEVVNSIRNFGVPPHGSVPGGPISTI